MAENKILGAYGTWIEADRKRGHVCWIMIDPSGHSRGIGTAMMSRVLDAVNSEDVRVIEIAASQKSAAFFARFGAVEKNRTTGGWGPGLDRVDMEVKL